MKILALSIGIALATTMPAANADMDSNRRDGPCFRVDIQNKPVNTSNVQQNCNRNFNRTVQAGASNQASTTQRGGINDNKVRQYHYNISEYANRVRGE